MSDEQQRLQSALDAQLNDLAEQEIASLDDWYLELDGILDNIEQVKARISRFRSEVGGRIAELQRGGSPQ